MVDAFSKEGTILFCLKKIIKERMLFLNPTGVGLFLPIFLHSVFGQGARMCGGISVLGFFSGLGYLSLSSSPLTIKPGFC